MMRPLIVSFSGGQTSAYMARWIQQNMNEYFDVHYVFANTGLEDEKTLEFVDRCDKEWRLGVVWVEALVVHARGVSTKHHVVDFDSASRNGEPFECMIDKYGIPNSSYPHCTRELKLNPINSWVKSRNIEDRLMAVGIRSDEIDRMSQNAKKNDIVYPLIEWHPTTLDDVNAWFDGQPFKLDIPQYRGNCVTCFRKSLRKLGTIFQETPEEFNFFERMERDHGLSGHNVDGTPRKFFRKHRSVQDIKILTTDPEFKPFKQDTTIQPDLFWDSAGACSESCDIYADDGMGRAA